VFESRVLRRIFGTKREEVAGDWRRLHNEELHNLYASPNLIWTIKRRMRWAGHVARMGYVRNACKILVGDLKGKDHWEDLGECIVVVVVVVMDLKVIGWECVWTGCIRLRIGTSGGLS
jgi:hypothetical protein